MPSQMETLDIAVHLSGPLAAHIQEQMASGMYADPAERVESLVTSHSRLAPLSPDEPTIWINTEGVRRLRSMKAHPEDRLTADQVFGQHDEN